jgi:hypothetical protein
MRRKILILGALAAGTLAAQTGVTNASVSGVVKDKITGQPLANYTVSTSVNATWVGDTVLQSSNTKEVKSTTDSSGQYKLMDLPPGSYRIAARDSQRPGNAIARRVAVNGSDVANIDFLVLVDGTITGKVLDENKEPVPDVQVWLISREYYLGNLGYYYGVGGGRTNDLGEYTLPHVKPGRPYLLMVERVERSLPAHSEVPLNPKLRRRVPVRTWYPNSPSNDSAQALTLRPGEKREGVDVELKKSPSYCIEGTATGPMGAVTLRFGIEPLQPSSGLSSSGGMYGLVPGGLTAADGKFRICDLYPGAYRLSAQDADRNPAPNYGVTEVSITDEDLLGVRVVAAPGKPLAGEVAWDADPPATPPTNKVSVSLMPLFRTGFDNERNGGRSEIPGSFTIEGILQDDYAVRSFFYAPGIYIKDVTFSGRSVMYEPLRTATAMNGAGMRVVMAHDGATLNVQVTDKDGNPGADLRVLVIPADVRSEGVMAARLVQGQTNQMGQYTSQTLPPGKYYVMATEESVDPTPESMSRLWRSRNRYQEVELPPAGSAQVKLEPGKIE